MTAAAVTTIDQAIEQLLAEGLRLNLPTPDQRGHLLVFKHEADVYAWYALITMSSDESERDRVLFEGYTLAPAFTAFHGWHLLTVAWPNGAV